MKFGCKNADILNNNIIRIYEKKNDTSLFMLNNITKDGESKIIPDITVDQDGTITVNRNKKTVFKEFFGSETRLKSRNTEFSIAIKEGHNAVESEINYKVQVNIRLFDLNDRIYGLGDKAAHLNRRGYIYTSWNSDEPTQHNETYRSLYKSINFFIVNHSDNLWYGIFYPSSYRTDFDFGKYSDKFMYIGSKKGEYDYFLILGDTPREIISAYYSLIGKSVFMPFKFLGNHQSRWSYSEEDARALVKHHTDDGLPLDYIHFDIDYMKGYRVYTVDKDYIRDFAGFALELKRAGVDTITIIDPGVKEEQGYEIYDDLIKNDGVATLDNKPYINEVWAGDSVFPNYFKESVREYFTDKTSEFIDKYNVSGIWTDMNEPASFNGPLPDDVEFAGDDQKTHYHDEVHNLYAEYMVKAVSEAFKNKNLRPTVITRAAFATTTRYTASWNGDNQSLWDHLRTSLPQIMTMNMSGFFMNGVDVGGFGNDTNRELLIRWAAACLFMPYFRNHSGLNSKQQEPYAFDDEAYEIYKNFLKIRYRFVPYMYTLYKNAVETGTPMFAPLFYWYPDDENVKEINDQVMVGPCVMHAPIVNQGEKQRIVYLPKGSWVLYGTDRHFAGKQSYIIEEDLHTTAIFIKEGAIIPMLENKISLDPAEINEILVYVAKVKGEIKANTEAEPNAEAEENYIPFDFYWDDGKTLDSEKGIYDNYRISYEKGELKVNKTYDGYKSKLKFRLI